MGMTIRAQWISPFVSLESSGEIDKTQAISLHP